MCTRLLCSPCYGTDLVVYDDALNEMIMSELTHSNELYRRSRWQTFGATQLDGDKDPCGPFCLKGTVMGRSLNTVQRGCFPLLFKI